MPVTVQAYSLIYRYTHVITHQSIFMLVLTCKHTLTRYLHTLMYTKMSQYMLALTYIHTPVLDNPCSLVYTTDITVSYILALMFTNTSQYMLSYHHSPGFLSHAQIQHTT